VSVWAIIPTAGTGTRFGGQKPKPLAVLLGKPVIVRTLEVFEHSPLIEGVILIVHEGWIKDYEAEISKHALRKVKAVVPGGDTRTQSVRNGLARLGSGVDVVMVHDGVRPLVTPEVIAAGLEAVKATGAAIAVVAVKPTIKVVDPRTQAVTETLDRDLLWEVQTPQVFARELLERAYREDRDGATDDAVLVERLGITVKVYPGSLKNIKITTPEDLVVAEAFLERS